VSVSEDIDDFEGEYRVGAKVIEMAERVQTADKVVPGAQAKWGSEMDGVEFDVVVSVRRK